VLVRVLGRGGIEQHKGAATPLGPGNASYLLRFSCKVGDQKRLVQTTFQFGNTCAQTVTLQAKDSLGCVQGQMLVEAVDAVVPKALSKALTAPPTMRSFFAAAPKAESTGSKDINGLDRRKSKRDQVSESVCDVACDAGEPNSEKKAKFGIFGAPRAAEAGSPTCSDASESCNSAGSTATPQTQRKSTPIAAGQSSTLASPQAGKKCFGESRKSDVKPKSIAGTKQVDIFAAARLSAARQSAVELPKRTRTQPSAQGPQALDSQSKAASEVMDLTCDD
jgi:hypothetical protein